MDAMLLHHDDVPGEYDAYDVVVTNLPMTYRFTSQLYSSCCCCCRIPSLLRGSVERNVTSEDILLYLLYFSFRYVIPSFIDVLDVIVHVKVMR